MHQETPAPVLPDAEKPEAYRGSTTGAGGIGRNMADLKKTSDISMPVGALPGVVSQPTALAKVRKRKRSNKRRASTASRRNAAKTLAQKTAEQTRTQARG